MWTFEEHKLQAGSKESASKPIVASKMEFSMAWSGQSNSIIAPKLNHVNYKINVQQINSMDQQKSTV